MSTLIAVITAMKAKKYGIRYEPWGDAVPRKSTTGRCQNPHSNPIRIAAESSEHCRDSSRKAKPIQPISSTKPAITPKPTPIKKLFGEYAGDTQAFKNNSTVKIRVGGINRLAYHHASRICRICVRSSFRPFAPLRI